MSEEQFQALIRQIADNHQGVMRRIHDFQAEMEVRLAEVNVTLGILATGQVNLFNVLLSHVADRSAHGGAS